MRRMLMRFIESNGIRLRIAEEGRGPLVLPPPWLAGVLVLVASSAPSPGGGGLSRGGARYARLWGVRQAGGRRGVRHPARDGGRGRHHRRAWGEDCRRGGARLGRHRRVAMPSPAPEPFHGPRGDERALRA